MNVKVENVEKNVVQLEIEVNASKFGEGMQKSYKKNVGKFNIPGFRIGKAPKNIIENRYGKEVFYEDAINIVCSEAYDQAVEDNNIHPVDRPEVDIKQVGAGQNLIFTAKVVVKPEVELGQYNGVEVNKIEASVTDEDIEKELKSVAEKNARLITVEDRPIQSQDTAIIDFEGFIDGVAFEGGKASNYTLQIGSGHFIPGFEDQLIGAKAGDELDVNVAFPEEYHSEDLKGKPALFKVKIHEVKAKELPVIDDEFAKDISEFDTLDEYKASLKEKLLKDAEDKAKNQMQEAVIDKVTEGASVEIPNVMIEKHIDNLARNFDLNLMYQGISLEKYLEIMGMDNKTFRGQFQVRAEKEVKVQLILEKIMLSENISASEEELDAEIEKMAQEYKQNSVDFKKHLREEDIEYIKDSLKIKKTIEFLVENAKIV